MSLISFWGSVFSALLELTVTPASANPLLLDAPCLKDGSPAATHSCSAGLQRCSADGVLIRIENDLNRYHEIVEKSAKRGIYPEFSRSPSVAFSESTETAASKMEGVNIPSPNCNLIAGERSCGGFGRIVVSQSGSDIKVRMRPGAGEPAVKYGALRAAHSCYSKQVIKEIQNHEFRPHPACSLAAVDVQATLQQFQNVQKATVKGNADFCSAPQRELVRTCGKIDPRDSSQLPQSVSDRSVSVKACYLYAARERVIAAFDQIAECTIHHRSFDAWSVVSTSSPYRDQIENRVKQLADGCKTQIERQCVSGVSLDTTCASNKATACYQNSIQNELQNFYQQYFPDDGNCLVLPQWSDSRKTKESNSVPAGLNGWVAILGALAFLKRKKVHKNLKLAPVVAVSLLVAACAENPNPGDLYEDVCTDINGAEMSDSMKSQCCKKPANATEATDLIDKIASTVGTKGYNLTTKAGTDRSISDLQTRIRDCSGVNIVVPTGEGAAAFQQTCRSLNSLWYPVTAPIPAGCPGYVNGNAGDENVVLTQDLINAVGSHLTTAAGFYSDANALDVTQGGGGNSNGNQLASTAGPKDVEGIGPDGIGSSQSSKIPSRASAGPAGLGGSGGSSAGGAGGGDPGGPGFGGSGSGKSGKAGDATSNKLAGDPAIASALKSGGGTGATGGAGINLGNPFASLFGNKDESGSGSANGLSGEQGYRGLAGNDGSASVDGTAPADYFQRIGKNSNLFQVISLRYRKVSVGWETQKR